MVKFSGLMAGGAALAAATLVALSAPAAAQQPKTGYAVVYGTDPCPRSTDDNVVVCARKPDRERYRIPEELRTGGTPQELRAWASRATEISTYGATGPNTCSPVGPGGYTGCLTQLTRQAYKEKKEDKAADTAP